MRIRRFDKKDLAILDLLSQNCRLSANKIGKLTGLSRQNVLYRIMKLEKEMFLQFLTITNSTCINSMFCNLYLKLNKIKKEFLEFLIGQKQIVWVANCFGEWNLIISFMTNNLYQFYNAFRKIVLNCKKELQDLKIFIVLEAINKPYEYILKKERV
ncbi:MAG: AsnC family transcriptional regulator [Candidatus Nanoarchaeia archaeon]